LGQNTEVVGGDSKEEWQKLIESMPRRLATMINAKGAYTKY
jgi:hypothetical protein